MKLTTTGEISAEEVDAIVKFDIETSTGRKLKSLRAFTKTVYDESDWRGEYPPDEVFAGYRFEFLGAEDENKT